MGAHGPPGPETEGAPALTSYVWVMSGLCVIYVWPMYGLFVAYVWPICGLCVAYCGQCVDYVWPMCGLCMALALGYPEL